MKVLESTPERYDRGIRLLSRGAIEQVYARVAELAASPGKHVLDIGCGTGNLALACSSRGARVTGIDANASMLGVAARKVASFDGLGQVELEQLNAMELMDRFDPASFDAAVSCLLFSELLTEERAYVLRTLRTRVRPGGLVVIADEVAPPSGVSRAWWHLKRAPVVAATWLLTQTTTHPVSGLQGLIKSVGYVETRIEHMKGDFVVVSGVVPREPPC
jgi:demethylmenaquinone methyltransferase/2-methoxy-6-polyprenyl-1,4-benzoquinol methylase